MKQFFDSSILIPVFYADHPRHAVCTALFLAATKEDSFCALRSLGEVYATLTGLPVRPRITGKEGVEVLKQIRQRLSLVSLTQDEYFSALEFVASDIVGGAAYDALIARCAVKAGADVLLTWNLKDFTRFKEVAHLVKTPADL